MPFRPVIRSPLSGVFLRVTGRYVLVMNWDWKKLIMALVAAVVGWLTGTVFPAPGTGKLPAPVSMEQKRVPG